MRSLRRPISRRAWMAFRSLVAPFLCGADQERQPKRFLYDLIDDHLSRAGKGLRPALCIATCRAFGGRDEDVLAVAAALEMLHNAFLIHDDIEDGSELRRDRPTLYIQEESPSPSTREMPCRR
jgi:geranylgeranyl diphosphate synthase, type II